MYCTPRTFCTIRRPQKIIQWFFNKTLPMGGVGNPFPLPNIPYCHAKWKKNCSQIVATLMGNKLFEIRFNFACNFSPLQVLTMANCQKLFPLRPNFNFNCVLARLIGNGDWCSSQFKPPTLYSTLPMYAEKAHKRSRNKIFHFRLILFLISCYTLWPTRANTTSWRWRGLRGECWLCRRTRLLVVCMFYSLSIKVF